MRNLSKIIFLTGIFLFGWGGTTLPEIIEQISPRWGFSIGTLLWTAVYVAYGVCQVEQNTLLAIERFGIYVGVKRAGLRILCLPGIVDKVKATVSLAAQQTRLYVDDAGEPKKDMAIDFRDGSAPVRAEVWWKIISTNLEEAVKLFLYSTGNAREYIESVCDAALRPALQVLTLDEAREKKEIIAKGLTRDTSIEKSLQGIGIQLHLPKGIMVTDIILSKELEDIQALLLQGKKAGAQRVQTGMSYINAITAIMEEAAKKGTTLTFEQAEAIFAKYSGLDTIGKTGANVTLVGTDITALLGSLLGGKKP